MRLNLQFLALIMLLNLTSPVNSSLPNNNAGFNFEPIHVEIRSLFLYARDIASVSPQLITLLPQINVISSSANSLAQNLFIQKELTSYTSLVIGLLLYLHYTNSLDLTSIASYISAMLPYAQSIAALVPQIANTISQMELIDPNINTVTTTEQQLAYIAMVIGYLNYFAYLQSPF